MKKQLICVCIGAFFAAVIGHASAQQYPSKPIRLVVGQPPGGPTDLAARVYADKMRALVNEQVIVENRPGAASQLAFVQVAKAEPDGYTLSYAGPGLASLPFLNKSWNLDSTRDFTYISMVVDLPVAIAVSAQTGIKTFEEFIADLKANPGKRNYANMGATDYLQMEVFKRAIEGDYVAVRFNGAAPALQAIYSGDAQFTYTTVGLLKPLVDAGKMRMIAIVGTKRSALAPDVPTILEVGPPQVKAGLAEMARSGMPGGIFGLAGPAKLPPAIVNTLYDASIKVTKDDDFVKRMANFGLNTIGSTPAEYLQKVRDDMVRWRKITQDLKYEPQ